MRIRLLLPVMLLFATVITSVAQRISRTYLVRQPTAVIANTSIEDLPSTTIAQLNLKAGRFINDNAVGGLTIRGIVNTSDGETSSDLDILPFLRYYSNVQENQPLSYFGEVEVQDWGGDETDFSLRLGGGINYDVGGGFAFEGGLGVPIFTEGFTIGLHAGFTFFLDEDICWPEDELNEDLFSQGDLLVGGFMDGPLGSGDALSLNYFSQNSVDVFNLGIRPSVGYFVTDRIVAGLSLGYSTSSSDFQDLNTFELNPFGRYYFYTEPRRNKFFGQLDYTYRNTSFETDFSGEFSSNTNQVGVQLGVNRFVSNTITVEGGIGYMLLSDDSFNINTLYARIGVQGVINTGTR